MIDDYTPRMRWLLLPLALPLLACGTTPPAAKPAPDAAHAHPTHHRFDGAEGWAKVFDDPARDAWQKPAVVVDVLDVRPGMTVADVGAGTGYFEPWLARAAGVTGTVLAVDAEPDMVRYLTKRVEDERLTNVRVSRARTDDPALPAGAVDRILVVDTWHHLEGREAYAKKLATALRPGGRIIVVDFKPDATQGPPRHMRFAAEQVVRELVATGRLTAQVDARSLPEQYLVVATLVLTSAE